MKSSDSPPMFLRCWGSFFKFRRQVDAFVAEFHPLVGRGWQCYLVLEREPEDRSWLDGLRELGVRIVCLPRPKSNFEWRTIRNVFQLCRRLKPSVMVCTNMHSNALLGAWLARVPVRLWCKEAMNAAYEECQPDTWRNRLVPSIRLSCRLATRVIAVSAAVRNELVRLGARPDRVWVRHVPRRLGAARSRQDAAIIRGELGLAADDLVMATVGHAVPVKGWDVLLPAFARVAQAVPRARLVLVGSTSARHEQAFFAALQPVLNKENLRDKVIFAGHRSDVPAVLAASDLFVLPSRSEGCSYALIEAMEAGLPCVVTRVGAAAEVVREGANGFLVDRCDMEGLASALLRLAQDDALRARYAAEAVIPPCILPLDEYSEQMARDYESLLPSNARSSTA